VSICRGNVLRRGLIELVRQHPPLGVELLRHVGVFALPAEVTAVLGSEDMSDVTPRTNSHGRRKPGPQKYTADSVVVVSDAISGKRLLAIVVEPQGRASEDKDVSWPVYATTARKANRCPRAVVIIACWDRSEADEARAMAAAILRILKSRDLRPTRVQRELIESCEDLGRLDTWFDRALTASTVAAVFED